MAGKRKYLFDADAVKRTRSSHNNMVGRCTNPKHVKFKSYGARGITVCERWLKFENFIADMGPRPIGKTLDRIDGTRGYEPSNCRWATAEEQSANRSNAIRIDFNGLSMNGRQWSKHLGLGPNTVGRRLRSGRPIHEVLSPAWLLADRRPVVRLICDDFGNQVAIHAS